MSNDMGRSPKEIRALREGLGLTQDEFAKRFGLSRAAVGHWETGQTAPTGPSERIVGQLAIEAEENAPPSGVISENPTDSTSQPVDAPIHLC